MMISTRGRYALRVMLDLAMDGTGTYVPLDSGPGWSRPSGARAAATG